MSTTTVITGRIKLINDVQVISDTFRKRTMVIESDALYANVHEVEVAKERIALFNNLQIGQMVTVHANVNGREWTRKDGTIMYFTSLDVWRVDKPGEYQPAPQASTTDDDGGFPDDCEDDLPF